MEEDENLATTPSPDEDGIDETTLLPDAAETTALPEIANTPVPEDEGLQLESTSTAPESESLETTPLPMDGSEPPSTSTDFEETTGRPLMGGLKRVDPNAEAVRKALACAVLELNRRSNSLFQLQLVRVTDVYAQVVRLAQACLSVPSALPQPRALRFQGCVV
jgi:hypothetical protein